MLRAGNWLLALVALALACVIPAFGKADGDKMIGMVVGRTGQVLHIGVPQPVREGTVFAVKPFEAEPPIAEAEVLSCTQERPYMALAKVIRGDTIMSVPTGVRAYTDVNSVGGEGVPQAYMGTGGRSSDKFSIQAGAFYPSESSVREATSDYWQSYRLTYTFMKMGKFETQLGAEYAKGSGQSVVGDTTTDHTLEVAPVTLMGKFKPIRMGNAHLFLGAGAGLYSIRTKDISGADTLKSSRQEFGQEYSVGMESTHGWIVELRYRDIQNTNLNGYSLSIGSRF